MKIGAFSVVTAERAVLLSMESAAAGRVEIPNSPADPAFVGIFFLQLAFCEGLGPLFFESNLTFDPHFRYLLGEFNQQTARGEVGRSSPGRMSECARSASLW